MEFPQLAIFLTVLLLAGSLAGAGMHRWAVWLTPLPEEPEKATLRKQAVWAGLLTGLLTAGLGAAMLFFECQKTPMVQPASFWQWGRVVYHATLLWLLVAITMTDLRDYMVPDAITITGVLLGVMGAVASGDLQMMHLWIDWNAAVPGIRPPDFPAWIADSPRWHGLAWSLAGAIVGTAMTWTVRVMSLWILGRPALGFGDVTLMAMIGSFLGWQPTVCVFVLAPLCGIVLAFVSWAITGRGFIPYGPFLAMAAVLVMFSWRWLWSLTKWTFGDWQSLAIIAGIAFGALVVLLGVLRMYWAIPVQSRSPNADQ